MVNSGTITTTRIVDKSLSSAETVRNMQVPVHKNMSLQYMPLNYMYMVNNYTLTSPYIYTQNNQITYAFTDYTKVTYPGYGEHWTLRIYDSKFSKE